MRILGIDPGTVVMGYGVIESRDEEVGSVEYGAITCQARSPIGERLFYMHGKLLEVVSRCRPDAVAVEQPFVGKNVKSALAVGRAQAVAILVAASRGLPVFEYSPAQVKQRVASYGASSKEQVQEMVRLQLGLAEVPQPDDAADALAVALCHLGETRFSRLMEQQEAR